MGDDDCRTLCGLWDCAKFDVPFVIGLPLGHFGEYMTAANGLDGGDDADSATTRFCSTSGDGETRRNGNDSEQAGVLGARFSSTLRSCRCADINFDWSCVILSMFSLRLFLRMIFSATRPLVSLTGSIGADSLPSSSSIRLSLRGTNVDEDDDEMEEVEEEVDDEGVVCRCGTLTGPTSDVVDDEDSVDGGLDVGGDVCCR